MNRPLAAVPILAIVAIVALFVWGLIKTSPEPFAIPVQTSAIPLSSTETAQGEAQHVIIDNLPTGVPAATYVVPMTPTAGYPGCPTKDGGLCQIPAPVRTVPTTVIAPCSTETMATFMPGDICRWSDVTPTPIPTTGEPLGNVSNDLVPNANQYDHDRVHHDAESVATPGGFFR